MPPVQLDLAIETASNEWQYWIAQCGRIVGHSECCGWQHVALSGSIPLHPATNVQRDYAYAVPVVVEVMLCLMLGFCCACSSRLRASLVHGRAYSRDPTAAFRSVCLLQGVLRARSVPVCRGPARCLPNRRLGR
jgi:hypothetical protein